MNTGVQHLHHYLPYIFLIALIVSILRAAFRKIENPKKDKILLLTLILSHIQLLLGIYLLFPFPEVEIGEIMKDASRRFKYIEHPSLMLIAVILITIGKLKSKKIEDVVKANKIVFIYFLIAFILIALRIPWEKLF